MPKLRRMHAGQASTSYNYFPGSMNGDELVRQLPPGGTAPAPNPQEMHAGSWQNVQFFWIAAMAPATATLGRSTRARAHPVRHIRAALFTRKPFCRHRMQLGGVGAWPDDDMKPVEEDLALLATGSPQLAGR